MIHNGGSIAPASQLHRQSHFFSSECGETFVDAQAFPAQLDRFWAKLQHGDYKPRDYVLNTLSPQKSAETYAQIISKPAA